ncbi:Phosphoenolpyruvate-protein phosphotransferase [Jeotgalicoccus aerolatus]|uniref:Phosphoenolpyruvate-protein phosphotransferase n=1 Tax=Jeotgalicoccus aerolatus TaxID=709510 RepID=A0ABS4HKH8_9STAP|nr:phosphoenolpyruvate--protein phosphotransferase [Jeotgalicoccus aerolatus]MBP1951343.1 phosphotransferase system enzyme I (PtsI) [Jeotgalicoccus aerolatus]GGD98227.1 phosphoenolpyruvate-protein phosphotransferase [Jeotgalicoccus aerolatus]CAD2077060.1 Phosphoenolpyruvate-protein phosphotransferase [Jeotgalicoccus aerolatus]
MPEIITGLKLSEGIGFGSIFISTRAEIEVSETTIDKAQVDKEISAYKESIQHAHIQLRQLRENVGSHLDEDSAAIFDAHIMMLDDPGFNEQIINNINNLYNAQKAIQEAGKSYITKFESLDSEYMKARALDVKDICMRLIANIQGVALTDLTEVDQPVVVVADELTPSASAQLDSKYVKGIITANGGTTSHSAIIARSLNIPAVSGISNIISKVRHGDNVIIDGYSGDVILEPTEVEMAAYSEKQKAQEEREEKLKDYIGKESKTLDGINIRLFANIKGPEDINDVTDNDAEGVGLYRTEFLYMNRMNLPSEEEQFEAYKTVLSETADKPVIIRTLDIGGDKELSYLNLPKESNPFLGERSIRFLLKNEEIFRTQLRALVRASEHGNLKVMFPMVTTIDEFNRAKALLIEEKQQFEAENDLELSDIAVGIMVETPSAAMISDQLAKHVDFFSIGTNDLIQYTMAADRLNDQVSDLYQPYHPSVLGLIKKVIDSGRSNNKWVGVCGEMACDFKSIALLIGFGIDELSVSPKSLLSIREYVSGIKKTDMEHLSEEVLSCDSAEDVLYLIEEHLNLT